MNRMAVRADPLPDGQIFYFRVYCAANAAGLGTCIGPAHGYDVPSVPLALVNEFPRELSPRGVSDVSGQPVVFQHISDFQVLQTDRAILPDQFRTQFLQEILPLERDPLMKSGNADPGLLPVPAPFLFSGKTPLQPCQLF